MKILRQIHEVKIAGRFYPCPLLDIDVYSRNSGWRNLTFLVDTGTTISVIPASIAEAYRLDLRPSKSNMHLHVGGSTRRGQFADMRVRFSEYPQNEFNWPCVIVDEPHGSPTLSKAAPRSTEEWGERSQGHSMPCLLGVAGFVSDDFDMLLSNERITLFKRRHWWNRHRGKLRLAFDAAAGFALIAAIALAKCR